MNRLMLDFETLDVGECPIILSMGACVFNEDGIVDTLFEKINTSSCQVIGCTESLSTTLWWEKQSDEARNAAFGGDTNIGYAMGMLVDFYKINDCKEIWSKGAIADIRWANNILEKLKIDQPWKFYQEMCFRTFLRMSQPIEIPFDGNKHNALDDAIHQAKQFIAINKQKVVLEGFVSLPVEPSEAIKTALSYQCFDFIKVAQVYRNLGFDIPKKAEDEQSFFLHKFLILAIKHGNDFIKVFNAETKAMVEAKGLNS